MRPRRHAVPRRRTRVRTILQLLLLKGEQPDSGFRKHQSTRWMEKGTFYCFLFHVASLYVGASVTSRSGWSILPVRLVRVVAGGPGLLRIACAVDEEVIRGGFVHGQAPV